MKLFGKVKKGKNRTRGTGEKLFYCSKELKVILVESFHPKVYNEITIGLNLFHNVFIVKGLLFS